MSRLSESDSLDFCSCAKGALSRRADLSSRTRTSKQCLFSRTALGACANVRGSGSTRLEYVTSFMRAFSPAGLTARQSTLLLCFAGPRQKDEETATFCVGMSLSQRRGTCCHALLLLRCGLSMLHMHAFFFRSDGPRDPGMSTDMRRSQGSQDSPDNNY